MFCHKRMPQNLIFITGIAQLNNCVHMPTGQFLTTLNMAQVENTPTSKCQEGSTSIEPVTLPNLTSGLATSIGKDNTMGSVKSHPFGAVPNSSPFSQVAKGTPWVGAHQYPSHIQDTMSDQQYFEMVEYFSKEADKMEIHFIGPGDFDPMT